MTNSAALQKIATLARIGLTPEETTAFEKDLTRMLAFVATLGTVKTEGVTPLVNPSFATGAWRQDQICQDATPEQLLHNAPLKSEQMFLVPQIVDAS
jgi:aspartyl-tRNA(Asn)/glutamyl-tRNA(Gln) amidotransferase subunit C